MSSFSFDSVYLVYLFVGLSIGLLVEGVYLLFFTRSSYRKNINRRLRVGADKADQQSVLIQLRRERGLTGTGEYRLPLINLNQLMVQSGLSIGWGKFIIVIAVAVIAIFGGTLALHWPIGRALLAALAATITLPFAVLKFLRARRIKNFGAQFADAIDIIVRSLRAGHPVPVAINTVSRELPDPVGTEFGIVSDEVTYGADLETAIRDLYYRVGSEDLPLFVTAVAIQNASGGNLGEILENLSSVIRDRYKMRRKVKALAAEGRASALILSSLPIGIFLAIQFVVPSFYGSVWHEDLTKIGLTVAGCWMGVGNLMMYKMVNFKI
jgi:tight adherence protein B